jgi:hypothetical protein
MFWVVCQVKESHIILVCWTLCCGCCDDKANGTPQNPDDMDLVVLLSHVWVGVLVNKMQIINQIQCSSCWMCQWDSPVHQLLLNFLMSSLWGDKTALSRYVIVTPWCAWLRFLLGLQWTWLRPYEHKCDYVWQLVDAWAQSCYESIGLPGETW